VQRAELNPGFFCDYLMRWWADQPKFGKDSYERLNKLRSAGYKIISSLDIQAQAAAQASVTNIMKNKKASDAMMLAGIQPGTGRVQAMAVNRIFSNDNSGNGGNTNPDKKGQKGNWPRTTVPLLSAGGDIHGYQAGSVFKMFTIVAALERGLPLDTSIHAVSPYKSKYVIDSSSDAACPGTHFYCPQNSGKKDAGVVNMWSGLGRSINTYFVPLQERIGTEKVVDVAQRLGLVFHNQSDIDLAKNAHEWGAFTLGVTAQTPLEMANAYATLAADGKYCKPIPLLELRDATGKKLEGAEPECKQVVDPDVARGAVDAGRCPLGDQSAYGKCTTGTASGIRGIVKHPVFGKTGTTDDEKSATLIVSTKSLTMAGFYTDPDWPQTNQRYLHAGGVNDAVQNAMRDAMANKPQQGFEKPSQKVAFGIQVSIPSVKCNSVEDARNKLTRAGFQVETGSAEASDCPAGTVAKTDPEGKTVKGGIVVIIPSAGGGAGASPPTRGGGGGGGNGGGNGRRCDALPWLCPND
jgi:membrane peptidoglycan carboxypeptidase